MINYTVPTYATHEQTVKAQIAELHKQLLQTVGHNKRMRLNDLIDLRVAELRPYYLLSTRAQKAQPNFTPFLDVVGSVAFMVCGNGSYFTHVLGIFSDHASAVKLGQVEFYHAVKSLK